MESGKSKNLDTLGWLAILEIGIILIGLAITAYFWKELPPQLPWFYSLPWGEDQLIPKLWFSIGMAVLGIITVFNYFLSLRLQKNDYVVAVVVSSSTLLLILIYFASFLRVVSLMLWSI